MFVTYHKTNNTVMKSIRKLNKNEERWQIPKKVLRTQHRCNHGHIKTLKKKTIKVGSLEFSCKGRLFEVEGLSRRS